MDAKSAKFRRRWLQFSVTFLIAVLLLGVAYVLLTAMSREAKRQTEILVHLDQMREGDFGFDMVVHYSGDESLLPRWLDTGKLNRVRGLLLYFAPVDDISWAAEMENLEWIDLRGTQLSDISPLSQCTELRTIRITGPVSDISPLARLSKLEKLILTENHISDISPLAELRNVVDINLSDTYVIDISPLEHFEKTKELSLRRTRVADVSTLAGLSNLEQLDLGDTRVTDVTPLAGLTRLRYLSLAGADVSDFSPIENLRNLERLNLSTLVAAEQVSELQQALPNCTITRSPPEDYSPDVPHDRFREWANGIFEETQ